MLELLLDCLVLDFAMSEMYPVLDLCAITVSSREKSWPKRDSIPLSRKVLGHWLPTARTETTTMLLCLLTVALSLLRLGAPVVLLMQLHLSVS